MQIQSVGALSIQSVASYRVAKPLSVGTMHAQLMCSPCQRYKSYGIFLPVMQYLVFSRRRLAHCEVDLLPWAVGMVGGDGKGYDALFLRQRT